MSDELKSTEACGPDEWAAVDSSRPTLVNARALAAMLNISTRTLWRLLSKGALPQPLRLGGSVRWRVDEVRQWIDSGCPQSVARPRRRQTDHK